MSASLIASLFGPGLITGKGTAGRLSLVKLGEQGVSKDALLRLADFLSLSLGEMAQLLPISERTVQRYSRRQRFNRHVSEQILQIAEVASLGVALFGQRERFVSWLRTPCRALGNHTPASLLGSRFGIEAVIDELGRIEHGVVA